MALHRSAKESSRIHREIMDRTRAKIDHEPRITEWDFVQYEHEYQLNEYSKPKTRVFIEYGNSGKPFRFPARYGLTLKEIEEMEPRKNNGGTALMTLPSVEGWTEDQVALVKRTMAPGATNDELAMFLGVSTKFHLDPLAREIFFWKDKSGKVCIFTGIDGWKKAAMHDPNYAGIESAVVKEGDEFSISMDTKKVTHNITGKRGKIIGAWAIAYHKDPDRSPALEYCDIDDYVKSIGAWVTNPCDMIKKTVETHALRKQFTLTGLDIRDSDITSEKRQEQIRAELHQYHVSPEERAFKATIQRMLRSFHVIGVSAAMIEEYLGYPINNIDPVSIQEISDIGREILAGRGTWEQLTAPFGNSEWQAGIDQKETITDSSNQMGHTSLPNMDDKPWAGDRKPAQSQNQEQAQPVGNGKEAGLRRKLEAKVVAVFGQDEEAIAKFFAEFASAPDELCFLGEDVLNDMLEKIAPMFAEKTGKAKE